MTCRAHDEAAGRLRLCRPALLSVAAAAALVASAQTPATAVAPDSGAVVDAGMPLRDPFWPVGFVPPAGIDAGGRGVGTEPSVRAGEAEWRAAQRLLLLKGISRIRGSGSETIYAAVINGRLVEPGETVSVAMGNKTFRWRVTGITLEEGPVYERIVPMPAGK